MEVEKISFPKGWKVASLKDVGEIVSGGTPSTKELSYWDGDIPWITPADLSGYTEKYISRGRKSITVAGLKNSSARLMRKGSVLFSSRAPIGYVAISADDVCTNQGFKSIVPNESVTSDYLYYYLKSAKAIIEDAASGTTFKEISSKSFSILPIPLPPLAEQQRIVAKIEELFSELDVGRQELEKTAQGLKVYRRSVLRWAFESKKEHYRSCLLSDVAAKIQIGPFGSQLHREDYIVGGIPLINPMHISDGRIVPDESYTISLEKRDSLPNYILQEGDVIMGRRGEMGRCGLVTNKQAGWFCGTGSLYVRPKNNLVNSTYLYLYLGSETSKKYLEANAGGTTMANLNLKIVGSVPVILPPLEEQHRIVQEIDSRLSVCDKIETTIGQCLQKAETLRQSILKRAFSGNLVEQNPNDESIQLLLKKSQVETSALLKREMELKMKEKQQDSPDAPVQPKEILELIGDSNQPMSTKTVWQLSIYKDNIDAFYAELKRCVEKEEIIETRIGKDSFLAISNKA